MKLYDPNTGNNSLDIVAANNYYPGGSLMPEAYYNAENYRHSYQGSEKDDEITGTNGTHITTHYRENDTRLLRWWSHDPKANASESQYMSMGGNPIWHNDPLGDSIWIKFSLGKGNIQKVKYQDGKLLTPDGKSYSGNHKDVMAIKTRLDKARSFDEEINFKISVLESSKLDHVFKVSDFYEGSITFPMNEKGKAFSIDETKVGKRYSSITYFMKDEIYSDGIIRNDLGNIIHEVQHKFDLDQGRFDYNEKRINGIKPFEIDAVNLENKVYQYTGDLFRDFYGQNKIPDNLLNIRYGKSGDSFDGQKSGSKPFTPTPSDNTQSVSNGSTYHGGINEK